MIIITHCVCVHLRKMIIKMTYCIINVCGNMNLHNVNGLGSDM